MKLIPFSSVLLIDNSEVDNFVNQTIFDQYGVSNVLAYKNAPAALKFLAETKEIVQLILIEIYLPIMDGFEFIDQFNKLGLDQKHGQIILISTALNPIHKKMAEKRKTGFIEKPVTIEKLLRVDNPS